MQLKENIHEIIQCKFWSKKKEIHEKHIFQLYGTTIAYKIDRKYNYDKLPLFSGNAINVSGWLITSTNLSERAKLFSDELGIKYEEGAPLEKYPCIKCNVSKNNREKIYHLPFDQQYDKTIIEKERGECYCWTVEDAEKMGFRRAFRWRSKKNKEK